MGSNKYLIPDEVTLLKKKLEVVSSRLQTSVKGSEFQTQEELLAEAVKVMNEFYKDLTGPLLQKNTTRHDTLPSVTDYNDLWNRLLSDLEIIFAELENLESLTVANFNFITTEGNRLRTKAKSVSSKVNDFILYSKKPIKGALYFGDSFNDLSKIELNSSLLNEEQCEVSQEEGIIVLPVHKNDETIITQYKSPVINLNSNGQLGNNQEVGANRNDDISVIFDNNPDTWFEYEKVVGEARLGEDELILDLVLNLGKPTIVNKIIVNPNNFGTRAAVLIDEIETSLDGEVYTSIKDDIPIAGFTTEDEENVFTLAPSTSKYAGQGFYTFTPRKVKYIRFVFRQIEPYVIQTVSDKKLRYAIGLRDITVKSIPFANKGEFVSKVFETKNEIKKVFIESNQNPSEESELASIRWFISPNDGGNWHEIQPKSFNALSGVENQVPEILNINTVDEDSVSTPGLVKKIRLKALFERFDKKFVNGSSSLKKKVVHRNELHNVPSSEPFTLTLEKPFVEGTVSIIDPMFGSIGFSEYPYVIATEGRGQREIILPPLFTKTRWPMEKIFDGTEYDTKPVSANEFMNLKVGGEAWTHASSGLDEYTDSTLKYYTYNKATHTLNFGNGVNTKALPSQAELTLSFEPERLFINNLGQAILSQHTSTNKNLIKIVKNDGEKAVSVLVPKRSYVINLRHKNISASGVALLEAQLTSADWGSLTERPFINGADEFLNTPDKFSIDTTNGIIYLSTPTDKNNDKTLNYRYEDLYELTLDDWAWIEDPGLQKRIELKGAGFKKRTVSRSITPSSSTNTVHLEYMSLVPGTLTVNAKNSGAVLSQDVDPFLKETPFIDGIQEFTSANLKRISESIDTITASTPGGQGTYQLKMAYNSGQPIAFTKKEYFIQEETALLNLSDPGDWYVSSTGLITVVLPVGETSIIPLEERVIYWHSDATETTDGLYSVNYRDGIIYTERSVDSAWTVYQRYDFTNYEISYRIARRLPKESYTITRVDRKVRIDESEILSHILIPRADSNQMLPYYIVNYDYVKESRENITEIRDYLTPVIKDYVLKIVTADRII